MLKHSTTPIHQVFQPVIYEIADLDLTLLPTEVQQWISDSTGTTRISQADTATTPDGATSTFWQLYEAAGLLPTLVFEGTHVADNFLANCLL